MYTKSKETETRNNPEGCLKLNMVNSTFWNYLGTAMKPTTRLKKHIFTKLFVQIKFHFWIQISRLCVMFAPPTYRNSWELRRVKKLYLGWPTDSMCDWLTYLDGDVLLVDLFGVWQSHVGGVEGEEVSIKRRAHLPNLICRSVVLQVKKADNEQWTSVCLACVA